MIEYHDLPEEKVEQRIQAMQRAFPDAEVTGYENLVSGLHLPDVNDRHVLAAAITGEAKQIVTGNTKHFPSSALGPFGIEAVTPDTLLLNAFELNPAIALTTTKGERRSGRKTVNNWASMEY